MEKQIIEFSEFRQRISRLGERLETLGGYL